MAQAAASTDVCGKVKLEAANPDDSVVDVSIILVNYNTEALLPECLGRLEKAIAALRAQVIVVDNASRDGSVKLLHDRYGQHEIVANPVNVGFGRANNQVLGRVRGRYVLLLNVDAYVEPDALTKTIAFMDAHPRCGVLGARLVDVDGSLQPSCRYFPTPWNVFLSRSGLSRWFKHVQAVDDLSWDHATERRCDWVPGCYYLMRRAVVDSLGLFDPRFFLYYEEVDHCRAVKAAGWEVLYYPGTTVIHVGGESAKSVSHLSGAKQISELQTESELLYFRKHHGGFGVWVGLILTGVADALNFCKAVLRRRSLPEAAGFAEFRAALRAFSRTSHGRMPTR